MLSNDQWSTIRRLVAWVDQQNGRSDAEVSMRILKISEEAGEVAQAWSGVHGQNPRKGVTHSVGDVCDELIDVMVTAAVALTSISDNPAELVDEKLAKIATRSGVTAEQGRPS